MGVVAARAAGAAMLRAALDLTVALRGDLTRPKVLMRGVLSTLLGMRGDARDALPIPEVTALPPRW